jgi:hypothetical protein
MVVAFHAKINRIHSSLSSWFTVAGFAAPIVLLAGKEA